MELACDDLVFHFNKKHLEDQSIPPWALKTKGQTYYVNHVECSVPWSTKETPNSQHTKGSIKVKNALLTIDDSNTATIVPLTAQDRNRLRREIRGYTRLIWARSQSPLLEKYLADSQIPHSEIKTFSGGCGSTYFVTDIYKKSDVVALEMAYWRTFRKLNANEYYYKAYDDPNHVDDDYDEFEEDHEEELVE